MILPAMMSGSTPRSIKRGTAPIDELVCSVEYTWWPVIAARNAISAVSWSRISPTRITSGAWRILDRILEGHDVDALGVDVVEDRVEGGRLAAARGSRHEDDPLGARQHELQRLEVVGVQAPVFEGHDALVAIQDAQHHVLTVRSRLRGDAEVDLVAREQHRDAPVLRRACL